MAVCCFINSENRESGEIPEQTCYRNKEADFHNATGGNSGKAKIRRWPFSRETCRAFTSIALTGKKAILLFAWKIQKVLCAHADGETPSVWAFLHHNKATKCLFLQMKLRFVELPLFILKNIWQGMVILHENSNGLTLEFAADGIFGRM